jgi:RNA polymerase sigma-70 factor (ECF subfamily)
MAQSDAHRRLYEDWVRSYAPELYRYAYRLAGNTQIAEDLTQETFVEAWRSIERQSGAERARAWLFQILRYRYSHFLRDTRRDRQVGSLTDDMDAHPPVSDRSPLDRLADQDDIQMALNTLSPIIRQTFLMVFVEGLTCRETAQSLEIPLGTVLSRLDSGRRALRAALSRVSPAAASQHGGDARP